MTNTNLKNSFDRRWASYALAGGAILAAPLTANASLITNTQNISLTTTGGASSANLDMTPGDSNNDFTFSVDIPTIGPFAGLREAYASALNSNSIFIDRGTESSYIHAFSVGTYGTAGTMSSGGLFLSDKKHVPTTKGQWPNDITSPRLMGVQFQRSGLTYDGWITVSVALGTGPNSASLDVTQSAYDSDPVVTPEPSSMALLLMGAAGIAALRRRRSA